MQHRVVVTGMGAVTPFGVGLPILWEGLRAGRCAVRPLGRFDASEYPCRIAAEVPDFEPGDFLDLRDARRTDRFAQFAIAAASLALRDANLKPDGLPAERSGVILGTGIGGMETLSDQFKQLGERGPGRVSPFFIPMMIANMAAGQIAIHYGLTGPNSTVVTACAAGANAIGEAFRLIQRGEVDVMLTGGSEASVTPITVAGFCAMKALSTRNDEPARASRPFDAARDGFVLGEGAGVVVLESDSHARARGARIRAELVGYGVAADAYHIAAPPPDGRGGAMSMRRALLDAGTEPGAVGYVNAHGTSTPSGDRGETLAIKAVFGEHALDLPVSSNKSMLGHLLGAAGAVEFIATVLTLEHALLPPTVNYEQPDPECDLDYVPNQARPARVRLAISNSFGFGGQNATLVVRRWEE